MEINERTYWNHRIKKYGLKASGTIHTNLYDYSDYLKWNIFKNEINFKNLKILDLGCGYGKWAIKLAKKRNNVTGVDISDECIKNAKILANKRKVKIKFIRKPAQKINFKKNEFDLVISITSLQHLTRYNDWINAIKKIYKFLKPGGILFMIESAPTFKKNKKLNYKAERTFHKQKKYLLKIGFKILKIRGTMFSGYYLFWISEYFLGKRNKKNIQKKILNVCKKIDLLLSKFSIFTLLSDHKMMIYKK